MESSNEIVLVSSNIFLQLIKILKIMDNKVYQENGFSSRDKYLSTLAEDYGISKFEVCSIAEILGENEDFDGLILTLEDYSMMRCY